MRKKVLLFFSLLITNYLLLAPSVNAFCPVCAVTVGAGIGLSRYLGIDDTVTGLWVGGLIITMIAWTINWLNSKNIKFKFRKIIVTLLYLVLIVFPLGWMGIIGHPLNTLWGIDKLILGMFIGGSFFLVGGLGYQKLKADNNGHAYFPFQKVVMPVAPLIILSLFFYFITKR